MLKMPVTVKAYFLTNNMILKVVFPEGGGGVNEHVQNIPN